METDPTAQPDQSQFDQIRRDIARIRESLDDLVYLQALMLGAMKDCPASIFLDELSRRRADIRRIQGALEKVAAEQASGQQDEGES